MMFADETTRAMRDIDAQVLRPEGWDAPPSLFLLHDETGVLVPYRLDSYREGALHAPPSATPFQILSVYAQAIASAAQKGSWPHKVAAVVFASEAWAAMTANANVAQRDQIEAAAEHREIHAMPDRVEIRILASVDRHGAVRTLRYARGQESDITETSDADGVDPDKEQMAGAVQDGLAEVLRAFESVSAP